jgi:hypothetical protein
MQQRSPVIFWLLLAATAVVDAVVVCWIFGDPRSELTGEPYYGLAFSQLSLLCAWVVLFRSRVGVGWIVPFIAGFLAALGEFWPYARDNVRVRAGQVYTVAPDWEQLASLAAMMWAHVILILLLLWLLKPTRLCRAFSCPTGERHWQFATRHLLIVMTCLAALLVVMRQSNISRDDVTLLITVPVMNATLFVAVLATAQAKWPWPIRLAASLAAALAIAGLCNWIPDSLNLYLIQSITIWAWLQVMSPRYGSEISNPDKLRSLEGVP